jgi:DNA polymerase-3 subunit epsilon/CBS domain-containing protein
MVRRAAQAPMARVTNATPLIALDAIILDTETTGLDPANARIVEIGAVPLKRGRLDETAALRRLVNPGVAIPVEATRIHAIDDSTVASAPKFAAIWPDLSAATSDAVLIGHTFGFDLAVLKRECERADLAWASPRTLDTRLLAQVAEPNLGGYTLDHLASWLGLVVDKRHSALADAIITGKIFLALLPKLREGNIRTLAEAEQACLTLTNVLEDQHHAGWEPAVKVPRVRDERTFARIDPYPYRHRVADVMRASPISVGADMPLGDAVRRMARDKISSLLVVAVESPMQPHDTAIITERDVLRAISNKGAHALSQPVAWFASKPLVTVPATAFVYRALGRMSRLKLRHLGVENESGEICGVITSRDLLRLRAQEAIILGDELEQADDVPALGAAWARLPQVTEGLLAEGVSASDIAAVISRELGALTGRAGVLAERRMKADGQGEPPCAYALCILGSAGRDESLLAMDQDNAIVFTEGAPGSAVDQWFARMGGIVADILHEAGVPYCKGGVMAGNAAWRGSRETWRARIADWVTRSSPADLLSVDIFFDLVGVHGDATLANDLWHTAFDVAQGNVAFAKLLVEATGEIESGITMLGTLRTENGRIDLKKTGMFGIVRTARVLAIRHHLLERSTQARLSAVASLDRGGESDLDALARAYGVFVDLILAQQLADLHSGLAPSNKVATKPLSREQRARLRESLGAVGHLDALTRDLLF